MHSISSSNFVLWRWCTSTPFYSKRTRYSVHLSDSSGGGFFKKKHFFLDETKSAVLTCLRFETRSNIHYFWSFIMNSVSSSNFFFRPWCTSTPLFSKRGRFSVHLSNSSMGDFLKKVTNFSQKRPKIGFNLSTLRDRFQQLLHLKFHHALNIFIKLRFVALVLFYSVLL